MRLGRSKPMKTYHVQLVEDRAADYAPSEARVVHADDHEEAAILAIRQDTRWTRKEITALPVPRTLWALVADPTVPTHSTGVPMACHVIRMDFSPTAKATP